MTRQTLAILVLLVGGACSDPIDDPQRGDLEGSSSSGNEADDSSSGASLPASDSSSGGGEEPSAPCAEYLDVAGASSIALGELLLEIDDVWCEAAAQDTGVTLEARRTAADGSAALELTSTFGFAPQRDIVIVEEALGEVVVADWNANLWIDDRWWSSGSWDAEHDPRLLIVAVDDEAVTFCAWGLGGLAEIAFEESDPTIDYPVPEPLGLRCPLR